MKNVYHIRETTGWTIFYLLILFGGITYQKLLSLIVIDNEMLGSLLIIIIGTCFYVLTPIFLGRLIYSCLNKYFIKGKIKNDEFVRKVILIIWSFTSIIKLITIHINSYERSSLDLFLIMLSVVPLLMFKTTNEKG